MKEHEECGIINNAVKIGEQCVYSKTHICNGEKCKPYPCQYFIGMKGYRYGHCSICNKMLNDIRIQDGTSEPEAYCKSRGSMHI